MDDAQILDLLFARSEQAIEKMQQQYGRYCRSIAFAILCSREDGEECVSDAYLHAWNAIPPARPASLCAYLGRITRNLALNRLKAAAAQKRGGGQWALALEELAECLPGTLSVEQALDDAELTAALNAFLRALPAAKRNVFLRRYWYLDPVAQIATRYAMSESRVKSLLFRTRRELKVWLLKEGIEL